MANLKPTAFIKELSLKEAVISPEVIPGSIIVYNSSHYVVVKQHENSLGWILYCFQGKPESRFEKVPGGVFVPFGDELYTRPVYLPTAKSISLVKEINQKIQKAKQENLGKIKTGARIPVDTPPTEIVQYAIDGKISYDDAIQLLNIFNPRHLVRLAKVLGPNYKIEHKLIKDKEPHLLVDYAVRVVKKRMPGVVEDIIKTDPTAWKNYIANFSR